MSVPAPRGRLVAVVVLLCVTVLWGWTFIWMKQCLDAASRVLGRDGGATLVSFYVAVRFGVAAVALAAWPAARSGLARGTWRAGAVLGLLLFAGFALQMQGLTAVTPAVSAFLTSLYVVFAAILTALLHRTRPKISLVLGVLLATFGAGFIEGPPHLTFGGAEWMTVGCAFVFAFHILATDRLTRAHPPLGVTLASFVVTTALAAGALSAALARPGAVAPGALGRLLLDRGYWVPLALATFFSTIVALTLMNLFQRLLDPVRAAILFALEPIWTTIIAASLGYGSPTKWLLVGGGALLAGNVVAELGETIDGRGTDPRAGPWAYTWPMPDQARVFQASRLTSGNMIFPVRIEITPDRVTRVKPKLIGSTEESIPMAKVASVSLDLGLIFADIRIDSTGGSAPITSHGHTKSDARELRDLIQRYQQRPGGLEGG